jgi:hypothetical protein
MYLFSRRLRLAPGSQIKGVDWAARMTEKVNAIAETEVALWSPRFSPNVAALSWTTVVEDLSQLEATEAKLAADSGYLALVEEGGALVSGQDFDDGLVELIHADPDAADVTAEYVAVVTAVASVGQQVKSVEVGIEIAALAKEVSGAPTSFGRALTGSYGQVGWFTLYPSIDALQQAEAAIGASEEFIQLIDAKAGPVYQQGSGEQTIWRKLA